MTAIIRYCADSFEYLKTLEDQCCDVLFTDPPYSPHVHANLCSGSLVGTKAVPKYELPFAPLAGYTWLEDAIRVTKRWVLSFTDVEGFGLYKAAAPVSTQKPPKGQAPKSAYVRGGIWYKCNAMGQLTKDRPATAYEGIAILHGFQEDGHPKMRWNGRGSYGIWRANSTRGKKDRHPNEKPVDLAMKLVALFSERGETVFDPFCGSGAIGEACVRLGRNFIGLDNSHEWADKADYRLTRLEGRGGYAVTDEDALKLCSMKGEDPPMPEGPKVEC
jgi:hypothetical protein